MNQFVTHLEYLFEVVAAGREDHLVGGDVLVVADQGHVHKLILAPQLPNAVDYVGLVVGPLDAELCTRHPDLSSNPLCVSLQLLCSDEVFFLVFSLVSSLHPARSLL